MAATVDFKQTRVGLELKHSSPLIGCRFDPSGRYLFVSAQDSTIQRYDLLTGRKTVLVGHESWVRGMAFSPAAAEPMPAHLSPPVNGLGALAAVAARSSTPFTLISGDYHGKLIWWAGAAATPAPIRTVPAR